MNNKNIKKNNHYGIWGFGIVGKSAYKYLQTQTPHIQILDQQIQNIPGWLAQTDQNIKDFFINNDFILCSPGIKLHNYQQFKDKFITELDIVSEKFINQTIAITGTLGKTSITNLIQQYTPNAIAAGNIGYPLLDIINNQQLTKTVVLELSSFQLQYSQKFAPDIAILTNFYPNHLDHHLSEQEYFEAKCKIFAYQKEHQIALIPCHLIPTIQNTITLKAQIYIFCIHGCSNHQYPTFFIKDNCILLWQQHTLIEIYKDIALLPSCTFIPNWLIIIATLYLQKLPIPYFHQQLPNLDHQRHRLEYLGTYKNSKFYNDSKSTVWQATKEALSFLKNESCSLFLGGLSKGTDRTPLIEYLQHKPITVFAFGKEAEIILKMCKTYQVPCISHSTLEAAFDACIHKLNTQNVLYSPAGSSFDLFANYIERGNRFKSLFQAL